MLLEVEVRSTLAAADAAGVGLVGLDQAFTLENVKAAALTALVEDPLGEVDKGVAVSVGRDLENAAEELGGSAEGEGGFVRGTAGRLVVEVPEDDHGLLAGAPDTVPAAEHVHLHRGGTVVGWIGSARKEAVLSVRAGAEGEGKGEGEARGVEVEVEWRRRESRKGRWRRWEASSGSWMKHLPLLFEYFVRSDDET